MFALFWRSRTSCIISAFFVDPKEVKGEAGNISLRYFGDNVIIEDVGHIDGLWEERYNKKSCRKFTKYDIKMIHVVNKFVTPCDYNNVYIFLNNLSTSPPKLKTRTLCKRKFNTEFENAILYRVFHIKNDPTGFSGLPCIL